MKLKDFDFRIVKAKNEQGSYNSCSNDECVCNTPFLYGDEAKYRLGEFIDNGEGSIELWSGFYDSKGTKIYEGDIVICNTLKFVVEYKRGKFILRQIAENGFSVSLHYSETLEVKGNIHENAKLSKEKEIKNEN